MKTNGERKVQNRIIIPWLRDYKFIIEDIEEARLKSKPIEVIENNLMHGMNVVGELLVLEKCFYHKL